MRPRSPSVTIHCKRRICAQSPPLRRVRGGDDIAPKDWRSTRAWRKLRDQVVAEEPVCWLRLAGCTTWSQTADHVLTIKARPDLAMVRDNLRGACHHCNTSRGDTPIDQVSTPSTAQALGFFD